MKTLLCFSLLAFLILSGCSKVVNDPAVNQDENQLKSARTASPIAPWGKAAVWDSSHVLQTALWYPPAFGPAYPDYSFAQFPIDPTKPGSGYDFSPYYLNGETEYNPANYDLMAHFGYFSPVDVKDAVVEFTFPHIKYFLPHMLVKDPTGQDPRRVFTVKNVNNQTVITCVTDLKKEFRNAANKRMGSPMFCFLIKIDCGKGNSGFTTFWTDMKVNGVSVKGTIKNKVFACN